MKQFLLACILMPGGVAWGQNGLSSATMNTPSMPQYQQPQQIQLGANAQSIMMQQGQRVADIRSASHYNQEELRKDIEDAKKIFAAYDRQKAGPDTTHFDTFNQALDRLRRMLSGELSLSLADAYYTTEAAYGKPYLSRQEYSRLIQQSVSFIRAWMQQNGLNMHDNDMVHRAIQRFMSEPLAVSNFARNGDKGKIATSMEHLPFLYDYNDYQGEKDYRNLFLTKCLATGYGQCASMPALYLVLAESMGVKAYLTLAPQHSFIKYPDNQGNLHNYEPTSNWEISDKWYKDNMFISSKAIASGIFLDTLNSRQIVAGCIFNLAIEYMRFDKTGKEDFILACLKGGVPYFPKNNNLQSLFIYSLHLQTLLRETMRKNNIRTVEDIQKNPEAVRIYNEYMGNENYISALGYQETPEGIYEALLNEHEFKSKVQQYNNVSGKEKRPLFNQTRP